MLLALSVAAVVARAVAAEEDVVARVVVEDAVEEVLVGLKSWRDGPSIESAVLFLQHLGWAVMGPEFGRGIVLVGKDDKRDVVAEVKESMFMGQALV